MKCISCKTEIDPKWKHAIDKNICPFCGGEVLQAHLKELLATLRQTMDSLQKDYQEQLDDFLLSNYSYIQTNSPLLVSFVPQEQLKRISKEPDSKKTTTTIKTKDGEMEVEIEKMSDSKAELFHKRAGVNFSEENNSKSVVKKTKNIKELAERIRKEALLGENTNDPLLIAEANLLDQDDPDVMTDYDALVSDNVIKSGLPEPITGEQEPIPSIILNMANKKVNANNSKQTANERDMQSLQNILGKSKSDEDALATGKGGFSRS